MNKNKCPFCKNKYGGFKKPDDPNTTYNRSKWKCSFCYNHACNYCTRHIHNTSMNKMFVYNYCPECAKKYESTISEIRSKQAVVEDLQDYIMDLICKLTD